jgi:hypothetical protein
MATTWMKALHRGGGGVAAALDLRVEYAKNFDKTEGGALVDSYECDPYTAQAEFLFSKRLYEQKTGRDQGKHDVIAYHVRMSFKPGEVTAAQALELGRELALRWTKGRHQFIVAAHTNTNSPHAHIVFNSVNPDCDRKFEDFKHSAIALRRVSDRVYLEHGLSVIEKPGLSKGYNRAEYLGENKAPAKLNLLIDIQAKIQQGYGEGYRHWATTFNLKEMAKTLIFLQERGLADYNLLAEKAGAASKIFGDHNDRRKAVVIRLKEIAELQKYIGTYGKTREVYKQYRDGGWSKKFYAAHKTEIDAHRTAKKAFDALGLKNLPPMDSLRKEYATLDAERRKLSQGYKAEREEMILLLMAKQNVDRLLGEPRQPSKTYQRDER